MYHEHHPHHHHHHHHPQQQQQLPCLHCQPQDYIRMVQHLIERCLLLQMSRDDCIKALEKHASIEPTVTLTVWKELLKENQGFFEAYFDAIHPGQFKNRPAEPDRGLNFRKKRVLAFNEKNLATLKQN
ncbi:hypothetical protein OWV82_002068 [Melia azedarach]|uniref:Uncharacterized protein n=1 Tax=Melia azedarach TaxID=155640 RepID=A0ACC1Z0L3_MELAZ|nr:hypothetical protein OWV82_002068 [Melia azedarach]